MPPAFVACNNAQSITDSDQGYDILRRAHSSVSTYFRKPAEIRRTWVVGKVQPEVVCLISVKLCFARETHHQGRVHLQWPMRLFHREASCIAGSVLASDVETSSRLPSHCASSESQEPGSAQGSSKLAC